MTDQKKKAKKQNKFEDIFDKRRSFCKKFIYEHVSIYAVCIYKTNILIQTLM